jgi:hypothetical protein
VVRHTEEDGASQRRRGHAACSTKSCDALIANGGGERKRKRKKIHFCLYCMLIILMLFISGTLEKYAYIQKKENFIKFNLSLNNCFMFLDQKVRELKLGSKSVSGVHESE